MPEVGERRDGFAEINGAQLFYEARGSGEALLFLHAGIADSRMWDDQFDVFAQHYTVIRYDLRGFGRSELISGRFSNVEDVRGLLDFLQVERAHLVGISFGGLIALDFGVAHTERVKSLVLVAPSVSGQNRSEEVRRFVDEEEALLERGDLAAATELNLRMWVDGPNRMPDQVDPDVRERVREMQLHAFSIPEPDGVEALNLSPPAIGRLAELRVPTLIVVGDQDIREKITLAGRLAAEIPGAKYAVIPGVAHMVNMEKPEAFNRVVLDFLCGT
jgi:pimeloyl-ACP methyl ester carboxylesterase